MQTQQSLFVVELKKIILEEIEQRKETLVFNNFTEVGEFKYTMGVVAGLKLVDDFIDEAVKKSEQRNR